MHQDFGNNSILTPARSTSQWVAPEEVQMIIYYNDAEIVGGPTAFVPGLRHTARGGKTPQALYEAERLVRYRPGTALLYQLGTWHRGTPVNSGCVRVTTRSHCS